MNIAKGYREVKEGNSMKSPTSIVFLFLTF